MKSKRWGLLILLGVLLVLPGLAPADNSPRVRLTFRNQTPQPVVVAIIHDGFDVAYDMKAGWYRVMPGAARTVVLPKDIAPDFTMDGTGYYARSEPGPGQKKMTWSGKFKRLTVRRESFRVQQNRHFAREWMAGFRKIRLKRVRPDGDATAIINLKD